MKPYSHYFPAIILLLICTSSNAQKNIAVADSLFAKADQMKVKMGTQWFGKIWKFSFGDYTVRNSKMGWLITSSRSNLFNTKTEEKSTQKFFFEMTNKENDIARVNAANDITIKAWNEIEVIPHLVLSSNELILRADNFSAFITVNSDTNDVWALLLNETIGRDATNETIGILTNGSRKITIVPVSSHKGGADKRSIPAMGYELAENNQPLSAVQYYGGGALGQNKNIVWLHRDIDTRSKLVLSAAMTAILQVRVNDSQMEPFVER